MAPSGCYCANRTIRAKNGKQNILRELTLEGLFFNPKASPGNKPFSQIYNERLPIFPTQEAITGLFSIIYPPEDSGICSGDEWRGIKFFRSRSVGAAEEYLEALPRGADLTCGRKWPRPGFRRRHTQVRRPGADQAPAGLFFYSGALFFHSDNRSWPSLRWWD